MRLKAKNSAKTIDQLTPYFLIIAAIIGLIAAFVLTYDKIQVLKNSSYSPPCNINPVFSCGSVMKTEQASLLGVPNTIFGLIGFSMLLTFAVLLAAGTVFKRQIWVISQFAATAGVIFMHYLFFQGVYRINAICPWCFLTWMVTIPAFILITSYNYRHGHVRFPKWIQEPLQYPGKLLVIWYLIIFLILLEHFWYYWSTLI